MRSDDRFIEEIFEKEKAKRAEIKAARRRTVGICSSLALLFVIGLAIPSFMGIFSASKGFDSNMEAEDAPNGAYDIIADEDYSESVENLGQTQEKPDKNDGFIDNTETKGDGNNGNDGFIDIDGVGSDSPDFSLNEEGVIWENAEDSNLNGSDDMKADDMQESDEDSNDGKSPDWTHIYLVIGAWALALISIAVALIIRKRKNNKNII